ncbi:Crp/Fnr family transcriptional regulator [Constantimarinum furrinae]|uniref:Crp/Fnr family transcriptional regulator n=1 Tax=Constantimarinum furrinae TaxID=2562285 RepID=A0A7G8PRP4_9FLAO|nr:Crp/Fnr family transcriptional regulator [Constantimarinum furrinae]QNJ97010.1 Crp/Fnr family transcriptional regulator [Constantimarinum furrinae]
MLKELHSDFGTQFEPALLKEIAHVASFIEVKEGQDLLTPGQYINSMPLVISGTIKILRPDAEDGELLLYHLEKGDTCAMTMSCCLGNTKSEIRAVAETPVTLLLIPIQKMEEWSGKFKTWRTFVFASYHARIQELLESIDKIAFNNLDDRLESYINDKVEISNSKYVEVTHQQIASDLHSSRVVVSRLLKKMENNKKIKLHRSFIEVL